MSAIIEVKGFIKRYPSFLLDNLSFEVEQGKITGLIGRNGAGKTTLLKGIMDFIKVEGEIFCFDKPLDESARQKIGYVSGGFDFYKQKKLSEIARVTSQFYPLWSDEVYRRYLKLFELDENKKVSQLSEGMKVKFSIALALSHGAELLIMDEPTSGLDPLSREELCDIMLELKDAGVTILFSTHITSDLEKIADNVIYISRGKMFYCGQMNELKSKYRLVKFNSKNEATGRLIGLKRVKEGFAALTEGEGENATLDDIIIHLEAEREKVGGDEIKTLDNKTNKDMGCEKRAESKKDNAACVAEKARKSITLIKKEFALALHPTSIIFLLFSMFVFIPNYPYEVMYFFSTLAVFFICLTARENNDLRYTLTLPLKKGDVAKGRILTVAILQLALVVLSGAMALIKNAFIPAQNAAGMDSNAAFVGMGLIILGVFNIVFFPEYYKNPDKVGAPFLISSISTFTIIILEIVACYAIPFVRDKIDTIGQFVWYRIAVLAVGAVVYIVLTALSCKVCAKRLNRVDL